MPRARALDSVKFGSSFFKEKAELKKFGAFKRKTRTGTDYGNTRVILPSRFDDLIGKTYVAYRVQVRICEQGMSDEDFAKQIPRDTLIIIPS